jgi:glycosyltransferase involved in cell wall biosynthesis
MNEEVTIESTLDSIFQSITKAHLRFPQITFCVIVCINNSTDNTSNVVKKYTQEHVSTNLKFFVAKTSGKLEAIAHLLRTCNYCNTHDDNLYISCDADILLLEDCILELLEVHLDNTEADIIYARVAPVIGNVSLLQRLQKSYYNYRHLVHKKNWYFRGGCFFLTKKAAQKILDYSTIIEEKYQTLKIDKPLVDDVLLSRVYKHARHENKIIEANKAFIYQIPPATISDMIKAQCRIHKEFILLNQYFPDFKQLNVRKNYKKLQFSGFMKIPWRDSLRVIIFVIIDLLIKSIVGKIYMPAAYKKYTNLWFKTPSSKQVIYSIPVAKGVWSKRSDWKFYLSPLLPKECVIGSVVFALLLNNGKVVMVFSKQKWGLPGGHINPGETPEKAICREVKEECGVDCDNLQMFGFQVVHNKVNVKNRNLNTSYPDYNFIPYYIMNTTNVFTSYEEDGGVIAREFNISDPILKLSTSKKIIDVAYHLFHSRK